MNINEYKSKKDLESVRDAAELAKFQANRKRELIANLKDGNIYITANEEKFVYFEQALVYDRCVYRCINEDIPNTRSRGYLTLKKIFYPLDEYMRRPDSLQAKYVKFAEDMDVNWLHTMKEFEE